MRKRIFAAAAVAAFAVPAMADVSVSATMSGFSVQLVDLDPLDGVAPSLTFFADPYGSSASASAYQPYGNSASTFYSPQVWGNVAASADAGYAQGAASVTGGTGGSATGVTMSAAGSASNFHGISDWDQAGFYADASGPSGWGSTFQLSANTLLIFSAATELTGNGHVGSGYGTDHFSASASLEISGPGAGGIGWQSSGASLSQYGYAWAGDYPSSFYEAATLTVSFVNASADALSGTMTASVGVSGWANSIQAPIPEPGTYAMLLAGLGVLGFIGRRRRA